MSTNQLLLYLTKKAEQLYLAAADPKTTRRGTLIAVADEDLNNAHFIMKYVLRNADGAEGYENDSKQLGKMTSGFHKINTAKVQQIFSLLRKDAAYMR